MVTNGQKMQKPAVNAGLCAIGGRHEMLETTILGVSTCLIFVKKTRLIYFLLGFINFPLGFSLDYEILASCSELSGTMISNLKCVYGVKSKFIPKAFRAKLAISVLLVILDLLS